MQDFSLTKSAYRTQNRVFTNRSDTDDSRYTVDISLTTTWDAASRRGFGQAQIRLSNNHLKLRDLFHHPLCGMAEVFFDPWFQILSLANSSKEIVGDLSRRLYLKAGFRITKEIAEYLYFEKIVKRLLCDDPPDPHFAEEVVVISHPPEKIVPDSDVTPELANSANALAENAADCRGLAVALLSCIERAQGASAAGSALWERRHRRRASELSAELSARLRAQPEFQARYAAALLAAGFEPIMVSAEAQENLKSDLKNLGLPGELKSKLLALGATLDDVEAIRIGLMNQETQSSPFPANLTVDNSATAAESIAAVLDDYSGSIRILTPKLSVAMDGDMIAVSWPTNGIPSFLEIAPTVMGSFKALTVQTTPVDGSWRVQLKADGPQMFLRLRAMEDE